MQVYSGHHIQLSNSDVKFHTSHDNLLGQKSIPLMHYITMISPNYLLGLRVPPRKLHPLELRARLQQTSRWRSTCWCRGGTWWFECYRSTCPSWRLSQRRDETCCSLRRPWLAAVCSLTFILSHLTDCTGLLSWPVQRNNTETKGVGMDTLMTHNTCISFQSLH